MAIRENLTGCAPGWDLSIGTSIGPIRRLFPEIWSIYWYYRWDVNTEGFLEKLFFSIFKTLKANNFTEQNKIVHFKYQTYLFQNTYETKIFRNQKSN